MLISVTALAQIDFHRANLPQVDSNNAVIRFERNVNTYLWNANAQYLFNDNDVFLHLTNRFTSSLIRSQFKSFRDEQNFSILSTKKISEKLSGAVEAQSLVLSDNQTLGSSNAGIHSIALGASYRPEPNIVLTPLIGMRFDKQQLERDEGLLYRLYADADAIDLDGYRATFFGKIDQSDLRNRKFKNNGSEATIAMEFADRSSDSIRIRWLNNRNDFYVPADSNIMQSFGVNANVRTRNEQLWGIQNILKYDMGNGFFTQFDVNVESRTIQNNFRYKTFTVPSAIPFNTTVQEFRIEGGVNLNYGSEFGLASIGLYVGDREEKHQLERIEGLDELFQQNRSRQESRLDNRAFRNSIVANLSSQFSASDEIVFSGSVSLLRYDTPDTINTDDRDELLMNFSLRETHNFSHVFSASLTAEATVAHLIYLSREKSANNNWNRIFRLSPALFYSPSQNFRMVNSFEVSANYTVFDFESVIPTVKSYSFRQVAFLDSTSYDLTNRVGLDMVAHVRVYERGELRWQEFSERPLQRIEEVTFSPQIRYSFGTEWYFAAGFRSFAQKRFRYTNNIRQFESTLLSAGPTTNIVIRLSTQSFVEIRGWKEFQRQGNGKILEYSNAAMNVRYYF